MRLFALLPIGGRHRFSPRAYFAALSVILLIPTLLITWWLANLSVASEQAEIEKNVLEQANEISVFVDREIVATRGILLALAGSQFLKDKNFESFYRQASEVAGKLNIQIVLRDLRSDKQTLNTSLPWGADLLNGGRAPRDKIEEEALRSERPAVSNIFWGALIQRYVVSVTLPVAADGDPAYFLSIGIPTDRFVEIIHDSALPADTTATIVDRNGTVIARSERQAEFVGKSIRTAPESLSVTLPLPKAVVTRPNLDGISVRFGHVRSEMTGWSTSVGIPESKLQANSNRVRLNFIGAGTIVLLIAMVGAYQFGGRFSESFGALGIDRKPTREEFQILFEHAPNGVVVVDAHGLIALLNEQIAAMFGFSRDELIGKPIETLVPERLHAGHAALRRGYARGAEARPMGAGRELFGLRKDGSEFPIEIGLNPIHIPAGNLVMAIVVDITKRNLATKQLSKAISERDDLRRRFMQAQEDERLRLAHELHDQTGQSLTAIMLELKDIERTSDERDRERLRLLRLQMELMGKSLHHVAWELRPASLDELGLASSLTNYTAEWSELYGIETDLHCTDTKIDEFSNEIRTTIYRVVQEGLTNIAKHATTATSVSVVIDRIGSTLALTIEDNGHGFDARQIGPSDERNGLGLAGMRERLSLVGGEFELESSPGAGTTIFARIPIPPARTAA